MTTVLLIEYSPAVRDALGARLSLERDLDIVGEGDDAPHGISLAQALDPDIVLIDAETPDLDTAGIVRVLAGAKMCRGIVVLSQHADIIACEVAAAPAFIVTKQAGQASLVETIRLAGRRGLVAR